jgi:hypothetical protein
MRKPIIVAISISHLVLELGVKNRLITTSHFDSVMIRCRAQALDLTSVYAHIQGLRPVADAGRTDPASYDKMIPKLVDSIT